MALTLALLSVGCARQSPSPESPPPRPGPSGSAPSLHSFLKNATDPEIRARAVALAQEDLRAGTPHVAWCGTIGLYRPNIPPDKEQFVAGLPSLNLPAGCTDPLAMKGAAFAKAYNGELVKHLPLSKPR